MIERVVRVLGRPLEVGGARRADAIVVLGSPTRADGSLTEIGEERVVAGVQLWKRGVAPIVCMTGGRSPRARAQGVMSEAEAMAARARALGVSAAAILEERESRFTKENATRAAPILRAAGVRSVVIVTQPFHLRRGVLWFRRCGFEAHGHVIEDSVQFAQPRRGLKWIVREWGSLLRDLIDKT
jgi:uncharacterized SAM-binding protein YcdF (DUF218 family)